MSEDNFLVELHCWSEVWSPVVNCLFWMMLYFWMNCSIGDVFVHIVVSHFEDGFENKNVLVAADLWLCVGLYNWFLSPEYACLHKQDKLYSLISEVCRWWMKSHVVSQIVFSLNGMLEILEYAFLTWQDCYCVNPRTGCPVMQACKIFFTSSTLSNYWWY